MILTATIPETDTLGPSVSGMIITKLLRAVLFSNPSMSGTLSWFPSRERWFFPLLYLSNLIRDDVRYHDYMVGKLCLYFYGI